MTILDSIYWFPIKGFAGVSLENSSLKERAGLPNDRRFAITRGTTPTGEWMPSRSYYINSSCDRLLEFKINAKTSNELSLTNPDGSTLTIAFDNPDSMKAANTNLPDFLKELEINPDLPAPQIAARNDGGSNWDFPDTPLSIINISTVEAIAKGLGHEMNPLRYRGNLLVSGLEPWEELNWMGKRIQIGNAEIDVMRPIMRCPAPGVNPQGGARDIDFEKQMPQRFGHAYCGMYAVTSKAGIISKGDTVKVTGDAKTSVVDAAAEAEDYRLWPRSAEITFCEINDTTSRLSLAKAGPWPLPEAKIGQRLRFHLGSEEWTSAYITAISPGHYHFEIEKSETDDPVTEKLRTRFSKGDQVVVSGPFGRV